MKVTGSTIQQVDKTRPNGAPKPRSECRRWRLWATTEEGRKSRRLEGSYSAAQKELAAWVSELESIVPNAETFEQYAESRCTWRDDGGLVDVQTSVNDKRYAATLSRVFGDMRMDAITPEVVRDGLTRLKHGGGARGKELSGTYMNNLFTALNAIMQQAEDDGRIAANPCRKIKPPKTDVKERRALTVPEMDEVWRNVAPLAGSGDGRAMMILLVMEMGLRPQEALALTPDDVDLNARYIHVRVAMKERDGSIGKTKRPASVRDLPMTDRLVIACRAYASKRVGGKCFCENTRDGSPLRQQNVRRWWEGKRKSFGADDLLVYELRHSNLTKMARFMTVFDLKTWAGWSSIDPAKVYVHKDPASLEAAVRRSQFAAANPIEIQSNAPKTHQERKTASG